MVYRRLWAKSIATGAIAVLGCLLVAGPAYANSWPPMAVWLLHGPAGATLLTLGAALGAIVYLEGIILCQREKVTLSQSMKCALSANLASTLLGFVLAIGLAALPYGAGLFFWAIVYGCMVYMSATKISLLSPAKYPLLAKSRLQKRLLQWTGWGVIWFGLLLVSVVLIIFVGEVNPATTGGKPFPDWQMPLYIAYE